MKWLIRLWGLFIAVICVVFATAMSGWLYQVGGAFANMSFAGIMGVLGGSYFAYQWNQTTK